MPQHARPAIDPGTMIEPLRRLGDVAAEFGRVRERRRRAARRRLTLLGVLVALPLNLLLLALLMPRSGSGGGEAVATGPPQEVELRLPSPAMPAASVASADAASASAAAAAAAPIAADPLPLPPRAAFRPSSPIAPEIAASLRGGEGLAAGVANTTFFGVSARGRHLAYILDVSASMESGGRLWIALEELDRSLSGLPDYAWFMVVLFANDAVIPPFGKAWQRATPANLDRMRAWLSRHVSTGGGTRPARAFEAVFSLAPRPDAIFFLTDGEIPADTPALLNRLNGRGDRCVVNTIAFGNEAGVAPLERIAIDSGGSFRIVPVASR